MIGEKCDNCLSTQVSFARAFPVDGDGGYNNLFHVSPAIQSRHLKHKQYELKDHLGNVRVVVSDFKQSTTSGDSVPPYKAEVLAAYNYYPFGMLQPGMYAENDDLRYRFGFNGMLRDDDMTDKLSTTPADEGRGNSYDFGARMYNPRVTRFFSLDPIKAAFTWQSPYAFAGNDPVAYIDAEGKVKRRAAVNDNGFAITAQDNLESFQPLEDKVHVPYSERSDMLHTKLLMWTDVNDLTVVITSIIPWMDPVHIDSSPASAEDVEAATRGLMLPGVSGRAAKQIGDKIEGILKIEKKIPNPFGPKGKPDHQEGVRKAISDLKDEAKPGQSVPETGTNMYELSRRPDAMLIDDKTNKTLKIIEVERKPNSKRNKTREDEYNKAGIPNETRPLKGK